MADERETLPAIEPGGREGQSVSIITDPFMVLESFRRGWHGSLEEAQRQYENARLDTEEYCQTGISDEERMVARQNLAKLSMMLFGQHTKAVQVAHAQTKDDAPGATNNTQINNTIDLSGLTVEQLRALAGGTDD